MSIKTVTITVCDTCEQAIQAKETCFVCGQNICDAHTVRYERYDKKTYLSGLAYITVCPKCANRPEKQP